MIVKEEHLFSELTGQVIRCAMRVHTALGNGFQEVIYQRALALELDSERIPFEREVSMSIYYKDRCIGERRVDFLVNRCVSVELKAVTKLEPVHFSQAINYLEAYKLKIGLLINFGERRLNFKRFVNNKL